MTDRTTITLDADLDLMVAPHDAGVRLSLLPVREAPAHISITVATSTLLAAIDAADPEAMRGYLRERSDYLDSPHDRTNLAGAGAGPAAEHFDYLDAGPEADSPEDTDRPASLEEIRESGRQLGEAWRAFTEGVRAGTFGTDR